MQPAFESLEKPLGVASTAAGRIEKHHPGRIRTGPGTLVTGQSPQISRLRLAPARVQHRRTGLVHEQMPGLFQVPDEPVHHRSEVKRGLANPVGERGAVQVHPRAGVDLRLTVERQVVRILGNQHLRQRTLGRQAPLDEVRRRGSLDNPLPAGPAGILRAHGDDDAELRRHDVQPLDAILSDAHHPSASAGTVDAVRLDGPLDARQVFGQLADIAPRGAALAGGGTCRRTCPGRLLGFADRAFQILQSQGHLAVVHVRVPLLRLPAVDQPAQFADQVFQPTVGIAQLLDLRTKLLVVVMLAFQRRVLLFEQLPVSERQRLQIDRFRMTFHDRILPYNQSVINENRSQKGRSPGAICRLAGQAAVRGRRTLGDHARRQSRPSNRASNCARVNRIMPSRTPGQENRPCSRRL